MTRPDRRVPRATYRVQLNAGFTLDDAAATVPYLSGLGISHLYASPILQATAGSTHGYDVVDHSRISSELGGSEAFERLAATLRAHDMGLVLDIVPNHMAISSQENRWWWDLLERGASSPHASYFDVDLGAGPILLPVLRDEYRRALEAGAIRLVHDEGRLIVEHADRRFPVDPRSAAPILAAPDRDAAVARINAQPARLDALLGQQHYRLASWRAARGDLRYRRFFDVDDLVGLRVEDEAVFADTHRLVLALVADGLVDGLRIDHPDGLRDPSAYLARLRAAAPDAWIVVEKILGVEEPLPGGWPIDGTTGYRFANLATGLFVDPHGEAAMSVTWASVADAGPEWGAIVSGARLDALSSLLGGDVRRLAELFEPLCRAAGLAGDRRFLEDVIHEVAARLPVYRTYVTATPLRVTERDAGLIRRAVDSAVAARPDLDRDLLELLSRILRLATGGPAAAELAMRFQQLTPAAMAKGVEDTAFYRHHRLVALNEVGGDPGRFGISLDAFHRHLAEEASAWPAAMLSLSTHDTKRSADVRARLAILSEDPDAWQDAVDRLGRASEPHRSATDWPTRADAYLCFQTIVGAWPIEVDRVADYLRKAAREAKLRTSWISPDAAYEAALERFVRGSLGDARFLDELEAVVATLVEPGRRAALGQVALELTAPGVPDLYQGDELWQLTLVDPDNRRAVDYAARRRLLADARDLDAAAAWARRDEGLAKLWLVRHALDLRRRREAALGPGGAYRPMAAAGALAEAVVAFERGNEVITVVPRLVRRVERVGWSDTRLTLTDGRWRNLDGCDHAGTVELSALLDRFPVSILERVG